MKKIIIWISGGIGTLLLCVLLALLVHGWNLRHSDRRYHKQLPRSLQVRSEAFEPHEMIPAEFSCEQDGGGSPPLEWSEIPEDTKSFVLIAIDPDIPSSTIKVAEFTHWVLYNIPSDVREFSTNISNENLSELGVTVGDNGAGQKEFYPPCPLSGTHDYLFRLYALDVESIQPKTERKQGILAAMEGHVLAYGELNGRYRCQKLDMKAALEWNLTHMAQN